MPLNGVHVLASGATVREKAIKGLVKLLTKVDGEKQLSLEQTFSLFLPVAMQFYYNESFCRRPRVVAALE